MWMARTETSKLDMAKDDALQMVYQCENSDGVLARKPDGF